MHECLAGDLHVRAMILGRMTDRLAAEDELLTAAAIAPRCWRYWIQMANWRIERRDWRGAETAINEALAREPLCVEAWFDRGLIAEKRGDRVGARRWYRRALLLRARLAQRPGLNVLEEWLSWSKPFYERHIRGRLLNVGGER